MSHIPYTLCRSGTYYYNRRVPKHAVKAYGHSSGKLCPNALKKLKLMQNVWVMYWRDLGVIRPQYSLSIFLLFYPALNQDLLNFLKLQRTLMVLLRIALGIPSETV